jgi:hypothetical protein
VQTHQRRDDPNAALTVQSRTAPLVTRKYRTRMAISEYTPPVWNDENEMPLATGDERKIRITELLQDCVAMRPCRRHGDSAKLKRMEAELTLLLDAELITLQRKAGRES